MNRAVAEAPQRPETQPVHGPTAHRADGDKSEGVCGLHREGKRADRGPAAEIRHPENRIRGAGEPDFQQAAWRWLPASGQCPKVGERIWPRTLEVPIHGKVVVITGATSGIGQVAAEKLAAMGARIVLVARDKVRADATLDRLHAVAAGALHTVHYADLSLMAQTKRVAAEIAAAEPRIDVLINNAGAIFRQAACDGRRTQSVPLRSITCRTFSWPPACANGWSQRRRPASSTWRPARIAEGISTSTISSGKKATGA